MNQRPYITEQKLEFLVQQKPISNFLSEILFLWNWNNWDTFRTIRMLLGLSLQYLSNPYLYFHNFKTIIFLSHVQYDQMMIIQQLTLPVFFLILSHIEQHNLRCTVGCPKKTKVWNLVFFNTTSSCMLDKPLEQFLA